MSMLKSVLCLSDTPGEKRALQLQDNKPVDLTLMRHGYGPFHHEIYLAKIEQWSPSMQGVFVNLGVYGKGFLSVSPAVGAKLRPGESFMVTVIRTPQGGKPAKLSLDIAIPGPRLIFIPGQKSNILSHRAKSKISQAAQLLQHQLAQNNLTSFIIKENALYAHPDFVVAEAFALQHTWKAMTEEAKLMVQPGKLTTSFDTIDWIIAENLSKGMVLIAQERYQTELKAKWGRICSDLLDRFIIKEHGVVDSMIEEAIHSALDHIVPFGSAGNLIFEQTAALTSIDVNAFAGNQSAKSTRQLFTLNMQAVPEIVRNIRLKGIGGAIVIDFINMNDDNTRQMVEGEMKKLFQDDPAEVDILPISRLGLMQMTRERTGMLVNELYCEPPKPQEYSLETIVVKLLKVLQEQHEIHPQSRLKVVAHHDLIEWISSRKYWLDLLSQSAAEKIDWQHDSKCFATEPYIHIDRLQEPVFV